MDNLFLVAIICREVSKSSNKEEIKEWLGYSGESLHITYTKKNLPNVGEFKIDVTVRNVQKMNCELKGTVNMKLQGRKTSKLNDVLYVPQAVKNLLRILSLVSK